MKGVFVAMMLALAVGALAAHGQTFELAAQSRSLRQD